MIIKANIRNPLRCLLITLLPLRDIQQEFEVLLKQKNPNPPLKKRGTLLIRLNSLEQ
jgi:hypothetical protein